MLETTINFPFLYAQPQAQTAISAQLLVQIPQPALSVSEDGTRVLYSPFVGFPVTFELVGTDLQLDGDGHLIGGHVDGIETNEAGSDVITMTGFDLDAIDLVAEVDAALAAQSADSLTDNETALLLQSSLIDPFDQLINGSTFGEYLAGGDGNDTIKGGAGDDIIETTAGSDNYKGGQGSDTLRFSTTEDMGTITVTVKTGEISHSAGASQTFSKFEGFQLGIAAGVVTGDGNANFIAGGDANDLISGKGGNDTLTGGNGKDTLNGNGDNDFVLAGDGKDRVNGDDGDDELFGEGGNDTIFGGAGNDFIDGGNKDDNLTGDKGKDTILGGEGNDTVSGLRGNDSLDGGAGNDLVQGWEGNDTLKGGKGKDTLDGDAGADQIKGGKGDDQISGGIGDDTLTGGGGGDTFVFSGVFDGTDRIKDFEAEDLVILELNTLDDVMISGTNSARINHSGGQVVLEDIAPLDLELQDMGLNVLISLA